MKEYILYMYPDCDVFYMMKRDGVMVWKKLSQ